MNTYTLAAHWNRTHPDRWERTDGATVKAVSGAPSTETMYQPFDADGNPVYERCETPDEAMTYLDDEDPLDDGE